jgi:hypothetical protein
MRELEAQAVTLNMEAAGTSKTLLTTIRLCSYNPELCSLISDFIQNIVNHYQTMQL